MHGSLTLCADLSVSALLFYTSAQRASQPLYEQALRHVTEEWDAWRSALQTCTRDVLPARQARRVSGSPGHDEDAEGDNSGAENQQDSAPPPDTAVSALAVASSFAPIIPHDILPAAPTSAPMSTAAAPIAESVSAAQTAAAPSSAGRKRRRK